MKQFLNEGFRSLAFRDENRLFLKGKNESSHEKFIKDAQALNILDSYITAVKIPSNNQVIDPNKDFPFGGLSYDIIEGKILQPEILNNENYNNITNKLAEFLKQLEMIEPKVLNPSFDELKAKNNEKQNVENNILSLVQFLKSDSINKLNEWKTSYFNYVDNMTGFNVVHGDLWYENMIVDENQNHLIGIIDFENVDIFDKAIDYVPALYMGDDFAKEIIKINRLPGDYFKTIKLFAVRRQVISFEYILKYFEHEVDEELEKLHQVLNDYFDIIVK